MSKPYSYQNPRLSLWQSSVAEVHNSRISVVNRMAAVTSKRMKASNLAAEDDLMAPIHDVRDALAAKRTSLAPPAAPTPISRPISLAAQAETAGEIKDCAKTAAEFLWAEVKGDKQQAAVLSGELKFAVCDATGWAQCVTTYLAYKATGGNQPYRPNLNPVIDLGSKSRLAIIGDWGTGDEVAINLLQQVQTFSPDVLIHLGDVYYAGTQNEQQNNFLSVCRQVLGNIPLFSLCGNHDMYSGGNGYYWLVDQIGQQASYFCLQNPNWQFLAMDTGHNDNDPFTVGTNMTSLVTQNGWSEANWHLQKIQNAGGRRTVLLSHHQLFSPFGSVGQANGKDSAYNTNLAANFQNILGQIVWWFWGHEHTLAIYKPYMGLQRGRCVGASAVPVFKDQQSYTANNSLTPAPNSNPPFPTWNVNAQLGDNGTSYNNCFAIMTLTGASANVDYYQVPILGSATKFSVTDQA